MARSAAPRRTRRRVSGDAQQLDTGKRLSNASVSSPSLTRHLTRAPCPTPARRASKRTVQSSRGAELNRLASCAANFRRRIEAAHRDDAVPPSASLLVTTAPNDARVADGQESRERRHQRQRLVDADLDFRRSEARRLVGGHRHDAIRRQRLRQLDVSRRMAVRVCGDRPEPERERAEILSHATSAPALVAAAAAVAAPFGVSTRRLTMRWRLSSLMHLQRLLDVDRRQHVGRAIAGERQHAVVHGPQRHFAGAPACRRVLHGERRRAAVLAGRYSVRSAVTSTVEPLASHPRPSARCSRAGTTACPDRCRHAPGSFDVRPRTSSTDTKSSGCRPR